MCLRRKPSKRAYGAELLPTMHKNIQNVWQKQKLIVNIDSITTELSEMYQENQRIETKTQIELENKKKENLLKEKYMKQIDDMQRDMDNLKSKNEKYEQGIINIRRKSMILEQHNKTLTDQLGSKSFQFLMKVQQSIQLNFSSNFCFLDWVNFLKLFPKTDNLKDFLSNSRM